MHKKLIAGLGLLLMSACVPAPAATPTAAPKPVPPTVAAPTSAPTAQPTQATVVQPTPAFERVIEQEPKVSAPEPKGLVVWRDDTLRNDSLRLSAEDLPVLSANGNQAYAAWLSGKDGSLFLGMLGASSGGTQGLTFAAPDQANLLASYDRVSVAAVAPSATAQPSTSPVLAGELPANALVHIRHVLVGIPATPNGIGFGLGLRQETEEMLRHAQFLRDALDENNLANEKLHAEHLVNLIEGSKGDDYGDLNGNGRVDNPGDGFGVLQNGMQDGYVKGAADHARLAATAADATEDIKVHAGHVQIAAENTRVRTTEIRNRALNLLEVRSVADSRADVQKVLALARQTIEGVDLNGDELVAPVPGEGGVMVGYQHAQLMAGVPLKRPAPGGVVANAVATLAPAPTLVPTVVAAPAAAAAKPAEPVKVAIADNSFGPKSLSVPVGATVVWSQGGQKPHTVTADNDSFKSDLLKNGATYQHTFSQAGTFLYYCELHGGPGGEGMAAQVIAK
jgi:plastocyanin